MLSKADNSPARITARATSVLLAAGAFDLTPLRINCAHASVVTVTITYTPGAAGGAPAMFFEVFDGVNWMRASIDNVGTLTVNNTKPLDGTISAVDQAIKEFAVRTPSFSQIFAVNTAKSFYAIRFSFAEYPPATLVTPGTLGATVIVSSD